MKNLSKYILTLLSITTLFSVMMLSCRDDDFLLQGENYVHDPDAVGISASTLKLLGTRADGTGGYIASGPVNHGDFVVGYQYYYDWINSGLGTRYIRYRYGDVSFGQPGAETTGYINISPNGIKELVWGTTTSGQGNGVYQFSTSTPAIFTMDNVPITADARAFMDTTSNFRNVERDSVINMSQMKDPNRFNAGVLDSISGYNDLLWGMTTAERKQNPVKFDLKHRMCQFNLTVEVDNGGASEGKFNIDLQNAIVYISNLQLKPQQYSRPQGKLILSGPSGIYPYSEIFTAEYNDFVLVGDKNKLTSGGSTTTPDPDDVGDYENVPFHWNHVVRGEGDNRKVIYYGDPEFNVPYHSGKELFYSENFVIPDQSLVEGEKWPKIYIMVPRKDVNNGTDTDLPAGDYIEFSGSMPHGIYFYTYDEDGKEINKQPDLFRFWEGTKINLKVKINPDGWELEFVPVLVEQWVDKGSFGPEAKQAGIHKAQDLYNLISYWNSVGSEEIPNEINLSRYGFKNGSGQWVFQMQVANLEFELAKIQGMMKPKMKDGENILPFKFDFRGRQEYLLIPGRENPMLLDRADAEQPFYNIVTGNTNTGISSAEEFNQLILAFQAYNWQLGTFGHYNESTKKWEFNINQNLTFSNVTDLEGMMIPQGSNHGFTLNLGSHTVTAGGQTYTQANVSELVKLLTDRAAGIYYDTDFYALIQAYANKDAAALALYGTKTGSSWNFVIRRGNINLNRELIQGLMPVESTNPGDYSFNFLNYSLTVTNYDRKTSTLNKTTGPATLKNILTSPVMTGIENETDLQGLITQYNTNPNSDNYLLTKYGYYDTRPETPQWLFFIESDLILTWDQVYNKMPLQSGSPAFIFSPSEYVVTISGVPTDFSNDPTLVIMSDNDGYRTFYQILNGTYVKQ